MESSLNVGAGVSPDPTVEASPSRLNVALIGAGSQGAGVLLPVLQGLEEVEVVAICDMAPSRAHRAARRTGAERVLCTLEEAIGVPSLDAVVVACPPTVHGSALYAAIERDIPIFVEKPPTTSTAELVEIAGIERQRNRLVAVGMNFRYSAAIEHVHRLLSDGALGKLVSLSIRHFANKPRASLWGTSILRSVLLAQVVHPVDLAVHLAGGVCDVRTHGSHRDGQVSLVSTITHDGGAVTSLVVSTAAQRFSFSLSATTDSGVVITCRDLWEITVDGVPSEMGPGWARHWSAGALDRGYGRAGYEPELRAFFAAARESGSFHPGLTDLLPTYHTLDAIHDALNAA